MKHIRQIISAIILTAVLAASVMPASAAFPAGIAGSYYETDIVTYMFGAPITSYNIGGQTVIDAEVLNWHYGFDVVYDNDKRLLSITDNGTGFVSEQAKSGELVTGLSDLSGNYARNYFYTDIVTTVNGIEILSYNFGGRTAIHVESLINMGYSVIWDGDKRTLSVERGELYSIDTELGVVSSASEFSDEGFIIFEWRDLALKDEGGSMHLLEMPSGGVLRSEGGEEYVKMTDIAELLGAEPTLEGNSLVLTLKGETPPYEYKEFSEEAISRPSISTPPYNMLATHLALEVRGSASSDGSWPITRISAHNTEEPAAITVFEREFYIPAHTAAKLLGFVTGY